MKVNFPNSLQLTHSHTPIIPINNYFKHLNDHKIWLKRDDYTGVELSGNKVRKLDFLIADALDRKATHLITCGGIQSNHCRTTAFMAAKKQMQCTLFLRGNPDGEMTGNLLLNILAGVIIKYVTAEEYLKIDHIMEEYSEVVEADNQTCYIIPEGGSNATGAWGYIACFSEILDQIKKYHLHFDAIAVATGSGGTHAGLLIGKKMMSSDIEILSVNVCDDADYFRNKISGIVKNFEKKYAMELNVSDEEIQIIDGFVGDGYGKINPDIKEIIHQFAASEGIVLDPVYSAKAFYGLKTELEQKRLNYKNILFIHTGGIFGVFPFAADLISF